MNEDKNVITFNRPSIQTASETSIARAKSFKISSAMQNFAQYVRTVKAYALAGMPLEHIANAGEEIGDVVERAEIDASILESSQSKAGEIAEDENRILAWQDRGEHIEVTHQLPASENSNKIINLSDYLPEQIGPKQEIPMVEGINVYKDQATHNELANNPYLQAPADLKKAA